MCKPLNADEVPATPGIDTALLVGPTELATWLAFFFVCLLFVTNAFSTSTCWLHTFCKHAEYDEQYSLPDINQKCLIKDTIKFSIYFNN